MSKIKQTKKELEKQFDDQLLLLQTLANAYDAGNIIVAKSMATTIRVLMHDTRNSHSLLNQLKLKNRKIFDTSMSLEDKLASDVVHIGSFCGLVGVSVGSAKQSYTPYLDDAPEQILGFVDFDDYWNRTIFIDNNKNLFTRKEIVLAVANQDGGAHVDPKIEEKYKKLARENALGWKTSNNGKIWCDSCGSELAAIRQIGHEILRTFLLDYPKKKMIITKNGFVMGSILLSKTKEATEKITMLHSQDKIPKIGRNEKCSCGSGLKYKKCHGK